MKRLSLIAMLASAVILTWPAASRAQFIPTPPPTPPPDPMVYQDPGMTYRAPAGFVPLGSRHVALDDLGGETPVTLAAWAFPSKDTPRRIILQAQSFTGDVNAWDTQFEQQMRSQFDGTLFKDRKNYSFKNGMPAMFLTMSEGEGFQAEKFYCVIWADGSRGMSLVLLTSIDDVDVARAREWLSDVTAVRYPVDRD